MGKHKPWTKEELGKLVKWRKEGKSTAQMSRLLKRSKASIDNKFARGLKPTPPKVEKPFVGESFTDDKEQAGEVHWRRQYSSLLKKYQKAVQDAVLVDKLVEDIKEMAPLSYSPAPAQRRNTKRQSSSPQSAVLMLSDTHIGKVVSPNQTLGFGGYNFDVFLARLKYVEDSVTSILNDHVTTPVPELIIPLLGDMLDGALSHGVEGGLRNTLFAQYYAGSHALAQFVRNLASRIERIKLYTVVGNHPRWHFQRRPPTENRFSNLDMFVYAHAQALTADLPNVEWVLNQQPYALFEVNGFVCHASHGDHWRGGDKNLGIPNHAIGRQISTTSQLFNKHKQQSPHFYLAGHLHRSITLPHAIGDVIVNGGFPGLDNYALAENFNPVDPLQRFFMVHPKYGRTASYDLHLKFAEVQSERPYEIPGGFPVE